MIPRKQPLPPAQSAADTHINQAIDQAVSGLLAIHLQSITLIG